MKNTLLRAGIILAFLTTVVLAQTTGNNGLSSGGVTQLVAGTNVTLSPTNGKGTVTITASATGATAFSGLTSATNTQAAMLVGTGASISPTGSGIVNANEINGLTFPSLVSSDCLTNNGSTLSWASCGTGGGVSSFSGDGALLSNSSSTGAVTATLGATGVGYGVWGNIGASSGSPAYHALSTYPTAAFPTLNQSTTGTAANITGTSNSTLTTLSALSLPSTQVTGLGTFATQSYASPPAIGGTTPAAGSFTTLNFTTAGTIPTLNQNTSGTASNLSGTPALPNGTTATTQTTGDNTTKIATDAFVLANATSSGVASVAAGGGISVTGTGSGPYTGAVTVAAAYSLRAVSGTTDTILSTDCANGVYYTSSSAVAVTLPQATSSFATCNVDIIAYGTGTVTVTPTTSTINGSSTLAISSARNANITAVSGNYVATGTSVLGTGTSTIASGTSALGTTAISSATCATVVTTSASGVATTDTITWTFSADPTSTTGYSPATTGMLTIINYPTANNVNFKVCNNTSASITPGAVTLNWRVVR